MIKFFFIFFLSVLKFYAMSQQFYKRILCSNEVYYGIRSVQPLLAPCHNYKRIILYFTYTHTKKYTFVFS